jgi:hyperosmotically inducible periplasmic protein
MTKSAFIWQGLLFLCLGCSQSAKDRDLRDLITNQLKEEAAIDRVSVSVSNSVVTLGGTCLSDLERHKAESIAKRTAGVKEVVNQIALVSEASSSDRLLKQAVDSVLKKYPTVQAAVRDSVIFLQGTIGSKKAQKLFNALQYLNARGLSNELVITNERKPQVPTKKLPVEK